jgi:hypothetical protein
MPRQPSSAIRKLAQEKTFRKDTQYAVHPCLQGRGAQGQVAAKRAFEKSKPVGKAACPGASGQFSALFGSRAIGDPQFLESPFLASVGSVSGFGLRAFEDRETELVGSVSRRERLLRGRRSSSPPRASAETLSR